jgi:succinate dehydrogenase/fumarate reductase flavoprotein subunit
VINWQELREKVKQNTAEKIHKERNKELYFKHEIKYYLNIFDHHVHMILARFTCKIILYF